MQLHRRSYKGESYEKLKKLLVCITSSDDISISSDCEHFLSMN